MNILFYTELHPIRNELTHHNSVAIRWMNMISRIVTPLNKGEKRFNYKVLCHQYHYKKALEASKVAGEYLLPTTSDEFAKIKKNQLFWNEESIQLWKDILEGRERPELEIYKEILIRVKKIYAYDIVVFWGNNNYLANWLKESGVKVLYMELACMRNPFPPSLYIDTNGVNGKSSSAQVTMAYIKSVSEALISPEVLLEASNNNPLVNHNPFDNYFSCASENIFKTKKFSSKKKILVPLQIADDTNILTSSSFSCAADFLKKVLSDFSNRNIDIYVKPHPGAISRSGVVFNDHRECKKMISGRENIFWLDDDIKREDYIPFLRAFDGVVTINSSLGYEAMMLGVPTVALGEAMYKPKDVCYNNTNYVELILNHSEALINEGNEISKFIFNTKLLSIEKGYEIKDKIEEQIFIALANTENNTAYYDAIMGSVLYPFWSQNLKRENLC